MPTLYRASQFCIADGIDAFPGYTDGVRRCTVREVAPYRLDVWSKDRKLIVWDCYTTFEQALDNLESEVFYNEQAEIVIISHDGTTDYRVSIED